MYSSGYSQVSKSSPQAQKKMRYRTKGKSCGYYLRIIFFFSSLIQSLIIVSLVLFLVYGKKQDSPSTARIQDLEESFSRLSIENVALRHLRRNLTNLLNVTLTEKTRIEMDLGVVRRISNISFGLIQDLNRQQQQTNMELYMCKNQPRMAQPSQPMLIRTMSQPVGCNCGQRDEELRAKLKLVESNFTQTTERMRMDLDQIAKDRDNLNLEAIRLRRDKSVHEKEIEFSRQRCKDEFVQSLSGVSNVSRAFLQKIESLFPSHIAFQLTCLKQREHLEQIRSNCTSLSREVEDRFQNYLNTVGDQVSEIQTENSHLKAENMRLFDDFRSCSLNRTGLIHEHRQNREKLQLKHDRDYEMLLLEKRRLHGDIEVLENNVNYKNKEVQHLTEQLKQLNLSCMPKTGPGVTGGFSNSGIGSRFSSPGLGLNGQSYSSNFGSTGSGLNKLGLNGQGSSGPGSTGSVLNKLGLNGQGSSGPGSTGSVLNKLGLNGQGSSGPGSTGSVLNKLGLNGQGSSSSPGSTGSVLNKLGLNGQGSSSLGSTGSGLNKPGLNGQGSSSPGSTGSGLGKQGLTGLGSSGIGLTRPGLSSQGSTGLGSSSFGSTGSGLGKQGSTGLGSSGLGLTRPGLNSQGSTGLGSSSFGSTGSGLGKQGSTGLGSSGLGLTRPGLNSQGSTGLGSSSRGSTGSGLTGLGTSSLGSAGSNPSFGSSGTSANKPTSNLNTSLGLGSTSKSGSSNSGLPWFGSSNTGQNKPGTGIGRGTSSGSSLGTGRTSSLGGGAVNIAQHLQDLQRIINPSYSSEEKQDLSRMLG
nr:mucin-19-like isoform X1 [Nerophis lumbriciformis]